MTTYIDPTKAVYLKRGQTKLPDGIRIPANATRQETRRQMTDIVSVKAEWSPEPLGPDPLLDMLRESKFTP
jgi:hypothetical protein